MLTKQATIRFAAGVSAIALALAVMPSVSFAQAPPAQREIPQILPPAGPLGQVATPQPGSPPPLPQQTAVPQQVPVPTVTPGSAPAPVQTAEPVSVPAPTRPSTASPGQPFQVGPVRQVLTQPAERQVVQIPTSTTTTAAPADGTPEQQAGEPTTSKGASTKKAAPVPGKRIVEVPQASSPQQRFHQGQPGWGQPGWSHPGHGQRFVYVVPGHGHGGSHGHSHGFRHGHGYRSH